MRVSLKYVIVSIAAQLVACASLWIAALLLSSDALFSVIIYFYWPCILLVAALLGSSGESAMIAVPIYGMVLGMIVYGIIIAVVLGFLKKKRG